MRKLLDLLDLFRKGAAVSEPALWKNRSALTLALTALILTGCRVAKGYGYEIPISEADAASIAAGVAVVVGLLGTYATTDKIGIPGLGPMPPNSRVDTVQPGATPAQSNPVDRHERDYPRDTGGGG
jgi:hypothetical protein